jgi:hypothetical protein
MRVIFIFCIAEFAEFHINKRGIVMQIKNPRPHSSQTTLLINCDHKTVSPVKATHLIPNPSQCPVINIIGTAESE